MGNKNVFIRFLIGTAIRQTDAITVFVMRITPASDCKKPPQKFHARSQCCVIPTVEVERRGRQVFLFVLHGWIIELDRKRSYNVAVKTSLLSDCVKTEPI